MPLLKLFEYSGHITRFDRPLQFKLGNFQFKLKMFFICGVVLHVIFHQGKRFVFFVIVLVFSSLDWRRPQLLNQQRIVLSFVSKLKRAKEFLNAQSNIQSFPSEDCQQLCFFVKFARGVLYSVFTSLKGHYLKTLEKNKLIVVVLMFKMIINTKIFFLFIGR